MNSCDTCKHLREPTSPEHAKNYYVCMAPVALPDNMHFWDRDVLEGKVESSQRWITKKIVNELKHMLKDCRLHEQRI
jgi:hypothetical protein